MQFKTAFFALSVALGITTQMIAICPNECCPSTEMPIDCSATPPCLPDEGCACFPPLPDLLDGTEQPKFVNPLPNLLDDEFIFRAVDASSSSTCGALAFYKISRKPFVADLGIVDSNGDALFTPMFGYASKHQPPTYPGRTIITRTGEQIEVLWKNKLVDSNGDPLPQLTYVPVDETIHIAMPMDPPYPESGIPTVVHLHGGFTREDSDGFPDAWATPNFAQVGPSFTTKTYTYTNKQDSVQLWYHDHALGFTRLNNYAGLVGMYFIRGKLEDKLIKEHKIPSRHYEVPLLLQDKMFTTGGEEFFPYCDPEGNPCEPQPSVLPEFFGDFIIVNGKAWPVLDVEPRQYRIRLLNGADSRFFDLHLEIDSTHNPISFTQIGTDQGFLNKPVTISHLVIAPSQRADLVFDFTALENETIIMTNSANAPFPGGDPVDPESTGLVMAFRVIKPLNTKHPLTHLPKEFTCIPTLEPTAPDRQVLLFESTDQYCRIFPLLGTPDLGALHWDDPVTETPALNSTEIWEIYNTTDDAHPIHIHTGNFRILDRQFFTADQDPVTGALTNIELLGSPIQPLPAERHGLFDTVTVPPRTDIAPTDAIGQRTRIIMNFSIPGTFVWHCHILSHEDNEMMRPLFISSDDAKAHAKKKKYSIRK